MLLGLIFAQLAATAQAPVASFNWFEYTGHDTAFDLPLPPGSYRNPVLSGFHPDPSVTRAGDRFYLVNSTFAFFPGLPVFESTDLVHWRHVGNVIERPSQLKFDGLSVSRGVFAPSIAFHDGFFYVLSTAVDSGGNFLSVAADPVGPWSDPIWLPQLDGIDPSLFFDADGRTYLLNNGPPPGKAQYDGHRAIWIQQFDVAARKLIGPRKVLIDGGVDFAKKPIWIEGPHLYRHDGWYYLMCAQGGTSIQHSEVVLRGHSPWGPFTPFAGNPILTQRDLPAARIQPVINAGHADLVQIPNGSWWAILLASRSYEQFHYNTGRETFLLPVTWRDGWPIILERGKTIPYVVKAPKLPDREGAATEQSGNFTWRDDFNSAEIDGEWLQLRVPAVPWADLRSRPGWLTVHPLPANLDSLGNPSFLGRRQQHLAFEASTELDMPNADGVAAGIAAFQNENFWYFLGVRRHADAVELFLEKRAGKQTDTIASMRLKLRAHLELRISGDARHYSFFYDADGAGWKPLKENDDGVILSTAVADGFVGAVVGPYARRE